MIVRPAAPAGALSRRSLAAEDAAGAIGATWPLITKIIDEPRNWIKIDPELAHFVVALLDARAQSAASSAGVAEPVADAAVPSRSRRLQLALLAMVAVLALLVGWLLSIALPAAALLPR